MTSPHIGLTRDGYLTLIASSRLLTDAELNAFAAQHPTEDAVALAAAFLKSGKLTEFQMNAINEGRPNDLRLGNYDIMDRLGAGGMGTVYKARHRRMKRIVALKVLSAGLCKDESFVQRFQREVETIARLGHPNIVMAYDADEADIGHFLVMEFVDGRDLTSYVEKHRPISVATAVDCIIQSARGLAYAHSQNIIHRDIKPANLLRDHNGVVKVTDLGLARLNNSDKDSSSGSITQAGGILGTVDYMAPEQAIDSTAIDQRADIYSLGGTLYFLLTGRSPYSGSSIMAVLMKHREAPIPSLKEARGDVPPELEAIYNKMMAKSLDQRYASMNDVIRDLEAISQKVGLSTTASVGSVASSPVTTSGSSVSLNQSDSPTVANPKGQKSGAVVVVEPSRVQAGIIKKFLESQGLTVAAAVNTGAAAIAAVKEHNPVGIISALHLTDMDGVELAKQIRSDPSIKAPGFVLISSESDNDVGSVSQLNRVVVLPKPFTAEQLSQTLKLVLGQSVSNKAKVDRSQLRVLIADDTGSARINERVILQGLGFTQIVEVADGAQAIAAASQEKFDLIVTDYNMPLMDGYALISYLKQNPSTANIPILMVTTETSDTILDPVRKLGVKAIFDKAFPATAVHPVLEELFG